MSEPDNFSHEIGAIALRLQQGFQELWRVEQLKLPYNLNLLDEVRVNENSHSRILCKLLQYKTPEGVYLLQSFLQFLGGEIGKLVVKAPIFTAETDRVDLRVRDPVGNYSIIFENKINGAVDQPNQIDRYVDLEVAQSNHPPLSRIYVVYLTASGGSAPDTSLSRYRKILETSKNYVEANYRDHVLRWIEAAPLPNDMGPGTRLVLSAMEQFSDHLKGRFGQREEQKAMDQRLLEFLDSGLGVTDPIGVESDLDKLVSFLDFARTSGDLLDARLRLIARQMTLLLSEEISSLSEKNDWCSGKLVAPQDWGEQGSLDIIPRSWSDSCGNRFSISLQFQDELADLYLGILDSKEGSKNRISTLGRQLGVADEPNALWPWGKFIVATRLEFIRGVQNGSLIKKIDSIVATILRELPTGPN